MGKSSEFQKKRIDPQKKFRLNAKQVFLTYAQCDCPRDICLSYLKSRIKYSDFEKYAICQEDHHGKQEGKHLHVLLIYGYKLDVTDVKAFDIVSPAGHTYHPNIGSVRNLKKAFRYVNKEDKEVLTNMGIEDAIEPFEAFLKEPDPDKAMSGILQAEPEKSVRSYFQIEKICEVKRRKLNHEDEYMSPYPLSSFRIPDPVSEWAQQIGKGLSRCKILILIGPPSTGKTAMIRALGPHVFMRNEWSLDSLMNHASKLFIVFDDIEFSEYLTKHLRTVLLAMGECTLSDKYKKKMLINTQGKPSVIICNDSGILNAFKSPAWIDQFTTCYVSDKLFG